MQEKAITFPTDAKLMHRARERLVRLAKAHGVALRQSYARIGKRALIKDQRYAHAKQCQRAADSPQLWAFKIPHFGGAGDHPVA